MVSKRRRARRDRENTGGPSPAWMGSVVLLGLVAVVLVIVLIHAAISSPTPAAPVAASPGASPGVAPPAGSTPTSGGGTSAPASAEGRPAGCSTTGTDQTVPTSPPAGVTWSLASGVAVPSSAADGPKLHGDAGIGYCYSRTALGAILAASNLAQGTGGPQELQNAVLKYSLVPNQYAAQVAATPATSGGSSGGIQLAGFRVITYSPDQASIALSYQVPGQTDRYPQLTLAMQWYAGDWRVVPQPGPSAVVTSGVAPSLAGSVPWAGVS